MRAARGEWILFTDADVELCESSVAAALAYAHHHQLDLLTGLGQELSSGVFEKLLHPYMFVTAANTKDWRGVNDDARKSVACGNGRFLFFRRSAYDALGGHDNDGIRNSVIEDELLAKLVKRKGFRSRFVFASSLYRSRMYHSAKEVWLGWGKGLYEYLGGRPALSYRSRLFGVLSRMLLMVGAQLALQVSPYVVAVLALSGLLPAWAGGLALLAVVCQIANRRLVERVAGLHGYSALLTHWLGHLLLIGSSSMRPAVGCWARCPGKGGCCRPRRRSWQLLLISVACAAPRCSSPGYEAANRRAGAGGGRG